MTLGTSMKRALLLLFAMFVAAPASAATAPADIPAFYAGMGYDATMLSGTPVGTPSNLSAGGDIHLGYRFNRYFGAELGYSRSDAEKDDVGTGGINKVSVAGPNIDLLGYFPLTNTGTVSVIGTVGASDDAAQTGVEINGITTTVKETSFGGRAGAGLEWRPVRFFSVDLIGRYQTASFKGISNGGENVSMDFNIYF